jgi:phosphoribosylamine--glycine ligase
MSWVPFAQGSNKDLLAHKAHPAHVGFRFSDRISVFDFGALPDPLPGRGKSLERFALKMEDVLAKAGIPTVFDAELSRKEGLFISRRASHAKWPGGGAAAPEKMPLEFVPLEVIFRWGVPKGSSLLKRRPELREGQRFSEPLIEFSTKLEARDRLLDDAEAASLLPGDLDLAFVRALAEKAARALHHFFKGCGLELWDGKLECAFARGADTLALVDAVTPDELRLSVPGLERIPLSKELLRQWLSATPWAFDVAQCKLKHGDLWKTHVSAPPQLGAWRSERLCSLYDALALTVEGGHPRALLDWVQADAKPSVFVLGNGGREAALRWRLEQEGARAAEGMNSADVIWISMDSDLEKGVADEQLAAGRWVFGPTRDAAKLEWSKSFGREIAQAAGIPVPRYTAKAAELRSFAQPPVVKFDGLAAGKGVVVPETWEEAERALAEWGAKGEVLLEERCRGFEASAFFGVLTGSSGPKVRFLGTAQDFKRRFLGDEGPNTGGMGSLAPHPKTTADDVALFTRWAQSTVEEMAKRGAPFTGILYLGLMKDEQKGWVLIEYNARFGDPETQALALLWPEKRPVLRHLLQLSLVDPVVDVMPDEKTLCLSLVHPDYPGPAKPLHVPDWAPTDTGVRLFRTSSTTGRVAYLVSKGSSYLEAGDRVFESLLQSPWKEILEWRADILK